MDNLQHKYLRIGDLRRLRHLFFASRRPVEGIYSGRHASPQRGHSVEFNDYRTYMPGDELADIDWKVYGRSDRLFVKLFEHQSDMTVHLLVDASASMNYPYRSQKHKAAGAPPQPGTVDSKYDHACRIAASIGFLCTRQQDKVSFAVARGGLRHFHRPAGAYGTLLSILRTMEQVQLGEEAKLAAALEALAARVPRRGLLIVLSDLLEEPEPILRAMSTFTQRGGEVIVFHVLHADELKLPDADDAVFTDAESGQRLTASIPDLRAAYEKRIERFMATWSAALHGRGIDHQLAATNTPYEKALEHYLFTRASR